jgi:hypothetical protein
MPRQIHFRSGRAPATRVNGRRLGGVLSRVLGERTSTPAERAELIDRLATAAGIPSTKVQEILDGAVDLPPNPWLRAFSAVLDVPEYVLGSATDRDVSDFLQSLEPKPADVEMLVANAARSVITNCQCQQQPAAEEADTTLAAVLDAAAAAVRV